MSHSLNFAKDRLGKDLEWKRKNEEELLVIDPLAKAKDLKEERRNQRTKDRKGRA
jgi:peptidyl-prolyl cis-trans isomerase SDCCAG10